MMVAVLALGACGDDELVSGGDDDVVVPDAEPPDPDACEVAIIGGGVGGLHTAFRLAPTLGDGVCLFEKEEQLGGRIKDEPMTAAADSPRFGTGAMRVMESQQVLFDLATELGITLETPPNESDLLRARGVFATSKEAVVGQYDITPVGGDTETALYDTLRGVTGAARPTAVNFPDFRSYIRATVGPEEFQFLHDVSRFRADFEAPLDAEGYLDYLDEEWDVCCQPSYPVGGMSQFIVGMEEAAADDGARIFKGEPVSSINREAGGYRIVSSGRTIHATKVVIAVPPTALQWISGDVVTEIKAKAELQAIIAIPVITIAQWWPNRWWENIADPAGTPPDNNVWRAWTTDHCFNLIEMPLQQYAIDQIVTRSVYDDDLNCVQFWQNIAANGTAAVEAEIKRGLEGMFNTNGVTTPTTVTIPDPIKTYVQYWPDAWHWLRAGTDGITNADLFAWALEPLPGDDVALVGEAYNVQRSGWSDAAYKSSINLLNSKYGLSLPGLGRTVPTRGDLHVHPWSARRN